MQECDLQGERRTWKHHKAGSMESLDIRSLSPQCKMKYRAELQQGTTAKSRWKTKKGRARRGRCVITHNSWLSVLWYWRRMEEIWSHKEEFISMWMLCQGGPWTWLEGLPGNWRTSDQDCEDYLSSIGRLQSDEALRQDELEDHDINDLVESQEEGARPTWNKIRIEVIVKKYWAK